MGCLMIGGQLPRVAEVTNLFSLGVHPAAPASLANSGVRPMSGFRVPVYVFRDVDPELRRSLADGGLILLAGDATSGKTRTAYEAIRATLPEHTLIAPQDREALPSALAIAAETDRCILWLDNLERFLGAGLLTPGKIADVLGDSGRQRVIVASIRMAEMVRYTGDAECPEVARQVHRDSREVLEQARLIHLDRMFSPEEQGRARATSQDPRIADAVAHADRYGIAEYLAACPGLLLDWENGWTPNIHPDSPANPRGAALVEAAVDIRRAGWASPMPIQLIEQVHELYLARRGGSRLRLEPLAAAWEWACRPRQAMTALLQRDDNQQVQVLLYLLDVVQRRSEPADHVPEEVVRTALRFAGPADAEGLAATAFTEERFELAEAAYRRAYQLRAGDPEHPDTLGTRNKLALVLKALGRLAEAETEHRIAGDILHHVLGPDHPHTLINRNDRARVLRIMGRLHEAETEHRAVRDALRRTLGPEYAETLAVSTDLARVLQALGRAEDAPTEHRHLPPIHDSPQGEEHRSARPTAARPAPTTAGI